MSGKDWLLLFVGAIIGIPAGAVASLLASIIQGPVLEALSGYNVVRIASRLKPFGSRNSVFDGPWEHEWLVESDNWPGVNKGQLRTYQFWNFISAEYEMISTAGHKHNFRIVGHIYERRHFSGRYYNIKRFGYHGSLHLLIRPNLIIADGVWTGFSSSGTVKSGKWTWRKLTTA